MEVVEVVVGLGVVVVDVVVVEVVEVVVGLGVVVVDVVVVVVVVLVAGLLRRISSSSPFSSST